MSGGGRHGVRRRFTATSAGTLAALLLAATPSPLNVLDDYHSAVAKLPHPAFVQFTYTHTRSGPNRIVTEEHRVYRTLEGEERNDTVTVNGSPIVPARSVILHRPVWPYDVAQFAPTPDDYDVSLGGAASLAGRKALHLALLRKMSADFALKDIYLDARRSLPLRETFTVTGGDCAGDGLINFGPAAAYWLPTSVQVTCTAQSPTGNSVYKESIRFTSYGFPRSIPADVFNATGAVPTTTPAAAP
ncbi:MAG: hypothetical protein M3Z37_02240 [Candidatus Eremiobacteraeota bacterium]|nr:hypothetical protein [Candidatus Eremiobacteraeota bacterium]